MVQPIKFLAHRPKKGCLKRAVVYMVNPEVDLLIVKMKLENHNWEESISSSWTKATEAKHYRDVRQWKYLAMKAQMTPHLNL